MERPLRSNPSVHRISFSTHMPNKALHALETRIALSRMLTEGDIAIGRQIPDKDWTSIWQEIKQIGKAIDQKMLTRTPTEVRDVVFAPIVASIIRFRWSKPQTQHSVALKILRCVLAYVGFTLEENGLERAKILVKEYCAKASEQAILDQMRKDGFLREVFVPAEGDSRFMDEVVRYAATERIEDQLRYVMARVRAV